MGAGCFRLLFFILWDEGIGVASPTPSPHSVPKCSVAENEGRGPWRMAVGHAAAGGASQHAGLRGDGLHRLGAEQHVGLVEDGDGGGGVLPRRGAGPGLGGGGAGHAWTER